MMQRGIMRVSRGVVAAVVVAAAGVLCTGALLAQDAPEKRKPAEFNDAWMGPLFLTKLSAAAQSGAYDELKKETEAALLARAAAGPVDKLSAVNDLVYVLRACEYLPLAQKGPAGDKLATLLLENRELSRRLFRALDIRPKPEQALSGLGELVAAASDAVLANPDFATAAATAFPEDFIPKNRKKESTLVEIFQWYTNPKNKLAYGIEEMPWELAQYIAGTRVPVEELDWAQKRYARKRNPASSYFDVKYDDDHYDKGTAKKISLVDYTLPNLLDKGGVCVDQAYYSRGVCKSLGIPATIIRGVGASGIGHAWLATLVMTRDGKGAMWDCDTARYSAHKYYVGELRDPATNKTIPDAEMMLVGMAAQLPIERREHADAATALARLVTHACSAGLAPDMALLKTLAEQHNAAPPKDLKPVNLDALPTEGTVTLQTVEDLVALAVDRNLAHKPAWDLVTDLRKKGELPVEHLGRFFDVLVTRTADAYPDYSCQMVLTIVATIEDPEKRLTTYKRASEVYGRRPDLGGRILLAVGRHYEEQEDLKMALKTYQAVATNSVEIPDLVLDAAGRVEGIYRSADQLKLAVPFYYDLYKKSKRHADKSAFRQYTSFYKLGSRLAQLLIDLGDPNGAEKIYKEIGRSK